LRLLALDSSDEIIVESLPLDLPCLLLLILFGPSARALVVICWCLPLVVHVVEESTNRLLTGGIVRHHVIQFIDGLRTISA